MVLGGGLVGDDLVQLSQFQRCGIVLVIHAHDESGLRLSSFHSSRYEMLVSLTEYRCDYTRTAATVQHGDYDERIFVRGVSDHIVPYWLKPERLSSEVGTGVTLVGKGRERA
jgi:hypothetical protein